MFLNLFFLKCSLIDINLVTLRREKNKKQRNNINMTPNRIIYSMLLLLLPIGIWAQKEDAFRAYLSNNKYNVYLRINFYEQDVKVPGQELYGELPGYLGKLHNSFCWVITSCKVINEHKAELQLINDFGSEDLTATLTRENDSIYVLKQGAGNTIKVPNQGKWQKLPKLLEFKKR